jgi:predicted nucleotidyltransferase
MQPHDPNLPYLIIVAEALGSLCEELVFVGGCAAGLLLTDQAAEDIRATKDVDAVIEATSFVEYHRAEERLANCGFARDADSEVICRWRHRASDVLFDLMPMAGEFLGFHNRWYGEAVRTATRVRLVDQIDIRLIAAPAFVATKLEAFVSRGKGDYLASHDLEDVLNVVNGRPELPEEMIAASEELRLAVAQQIASLIGNRDFVDSLPGLVAERERAAIVIQRLQAMSIAK